MTAQPATAPAARPAQPAGSAQPEVRQVTEAQRLARAYLLRVAEPPAPALVRFVARHGPVVAAEQVRSGDVPDAVRAETEARRHLDQAEQDLAEADAAGARLVVPEDAEWPAWQFTALEAAENGGHRYAGEPLALWVRGSARLDDAADRAVAVVGARAATAYGEHVAAEFGHGIALAGHSVVSGAAYGIDGAAHRGALAAGGKTVAVLGCGVDVGYPAGHSALLRKIAESGAVVSEYAPGTPPARHRFLVRNRLIAGLSEGVVVVEAGRRSGARNTAATAAALGRLVMAVPGPITSAMSVGCHQLLRTGDACVVGSVEEVIETVGRIGVDLAEPPPAEVRATDGLDDQSLRVHEALGAGRALSADQIAVASGVPLGRVRALLTGLELAGFTARCEAGWRLAPAKARGDP
ncbi:MAG TPA: DNA-processing protein DprA [Pseudonocardiaceae bacterium]|jgi:DNA processing protein|nr:DNA-processing protein DprA [Pseudonocardiaceae bacterium]